MIIRKRTFAEPDSSWSVILNPVKGELAKSRAVDKISQTFSITAEEAYQLIENAPVILLEDLSYETANKIKIYLNENGLEIEFTNNPLEKRKCFKTVWPEEPRFNFPESETYHPSISRAAPSSREILSSEQAIAHIREEMNGDGAKLAKLDASENEFAFSKKYEVLLRQYNLLVEDKLIQDKKLEALEKEVRFLREKESTTAGDLKSLSAERENLLHEVEALRVKHELAVRQSEVEDGSRESRFRALESEKKAMREKLEALELEYDEAEQCWAEKLKDKEDALSGFELRLQTLQKQLEDYRQKAGDETRAREKVLAEGTLGLRETALKELVRRQEELEQDITDKERRLKLVLAEQERLEKEIVRAKQLKNSS